MMNGLSKVISILATLTFGAMGCNSDTRVVSNFDGSGIDGGELVDYSDVYDPEHSVARNWNESLLEAIRKDLARPTVHARNLFHSSALMYDLWSVFDEQSKPYFLGREVDGYSCEFSDAQRDSVLASIEREPGLEIAISYAMHRLLSHRFENSEGVRVSLNRFNRLLAAYGQSVDFNSRDFSSGTPEERAAALGLYIADCVVAYGMQDGSNEQGDYSNQVYETFNAPLKPHESGTPGMADPDRWQPLELLKWVGQSGIEGSVPPFVGAEWGQVEPFALPPSAFTIFERDDSNWPVCHDPGKPAQLRGDGDPQEYLWNHSMVAYWSSHLDPTDGVQWDISPGTIGNTVSLPTTYTEMKQFYNPAEGGTPSLGGEVFGAGHSINPATGEPYEANVVPRGDYTRVLAEFWADGPDSETPPGHWFTILNEAVSDHPLVVKKFRGEGEVLDSLEWDVKSYFALGGGLHDAAISAWGVKGWYDYVRPVSAIRFMASNGQSSDPEGLNYSPEGLPLQPGFMEQIQAGDLLAGDNKENIGKVKVRSWHVTEWKGVPFVSNAKEAKVDWILADDWVPYQRPTFVSPPFAGYVSGHSTFSRAAAEILTWFTGDEFFPGGMGEFVAKKDDFLVFEEGPSQTVKLQWATYRDASDQTSLSRIWGGIHPPVDDIPGRKIGITVAEDAVALVQQYFDGQIDE